MIKTSLILSALCAFRAWSNPQSKTGDLYDYEDNESVEGNVEWFYIRSKSNGFVIEEKGNDVPLVMNPESGSNGQLWKWKGTSIVSKNNWAIDLVGGLDGNWANGGKMVGFRFQGGKNQIWKFEKNRIINIGWTKYALETEESNPTAGSRVIANPIKEKEEQLWSLSYINNAPQDPAPQDPAPQSPALNKGCCSTESCREYEGEVNVTLNGIECAPWEIQYPSRNIGGNWCRNPDVNIQETYTSFLPNAPWCFTFTGEVGMGIQYCGAPKCSEAVIDPSRPDLLLLPIRGGLGRDMTAFYAQSIFGEMTPADIQSVGNILLESPLCQERVIVSRFLKYVVKVKTVGDEVDETTKALEKIVVFIGDRVKNAAIENNNPGADSTCRAEVKRKATALTSKVEEAQNHFATLSKLSGSVKTKYVNFQELERKIEGHIKAFDDAVDTLNVNLERLERKLRAKA